MPGMGLGGAGGAALVLLHGLALAALLSAFGSLLFLGFVVPAASFACSAVSRWSLALAIILDAAWLLGETRFIAGATSLADTLAALPVVIRATEFGHLVLGQILALAAAFLLFRRGTRARLAATLAGLATALEAWHLHGAAMHAGPSPILISELLHVLAAGAWLGGLLPLALFIRAAPPAAGAIAANRFSAMATPCVLVLAASALWQGRILIGSVAALFGTAYGWIALAKLGLFVMLFAFAARHRLELTPALSAERSASSADSFAARRALVRSIFVEMALGLAIVLVATVIASLAPPTDMAMMG
ncbi:MAG TPA: CopD family protein [Acetobacteraceae bacterium]|nr:CopD family protein [Acetobacteraceae bacterium]